MPAIKVRRAKPCPPATVRIPCLALPERYSPRQIVAAAAWFKANPDGIGEIHDSHGSTGHTLTAAGWFAWFRSKLMEKINARDTRFVTGDEDYQRELWRLKQYVGTRLVIRRHSLNWQLLGSRVLAAMEPRFCDE